jgi:LPS-assembly protein
VTGVSIKFTWWLIISFALGPFAYGAVNLERSNLMLGRITLESDRLTYKDGLAVANGNVIVRGNNMIVMGDSFTYDLANGSLEAKNVKSNVRPMILVADEVVIAETVMAKNARMYFMEPDSFSPNIGAREMEFSADNNRCSLKHVTFRIGQVPVFYLPGLSMRVDMLPVISTEYGVNNRHGAFVQNKFLFNVNNNVKLGALFDVYTKSGILVGPAIRYHKHDETSSIFGSLEAGFISDNAKRGLDVFGQPIKRHRFFSELRYKQHMVDHIDVTGQLSWLSDSEVERDFRKAIYNGNRYANTFAEVVYRDDWYLLSIFGQFRPNGFYNTVERMPQLRFDTITMQLPWIGLYHNFFAEISQLRNRSIDECNHIMRFDSYYGLARPTHMGDALTITPVAGGRFTCYDKTLGSQGSYQRFIGQLGADVEMFGHGFIGYNNEFFDICGLKHLIKPLAQYRYTPKASIGSSKIPPVDRHYFDTNIPTIDLRDMRDVDQPRAGNLLRIGIENSLFTQGKSNYLARKVAEFSVYQDLRFGHYDFNFDTNANHCLSDSYLKLELSPFSLVKFRAYSRIDPNKITLKELTTATELMNGDLWRIGFFTKALQHELDQYGVGLAWNFNAITGARISARFDARTKKLIEHDYFVSTMIGNSWKCEFGITVKNGSVREAKFQPAFRVDLVSW